jgi:TetR/AcrR family transcriptional regulator
MARPRRTATADPGTRDRLFHAAAAEFAARGFAGANIDRIARGARLNRAMIYYHFKSKADVYRHILDDMFGAVEARVRDAAASSIPPEDKIRAFVLAIATEAEARPHFPSIWFREIAEGGVHLDVHTLRHLSEVLKALKAIIDEGVRAGCFRPFNPLLVHAGIVAPLLLFFASAPIRQRLTKAGVAAAAQIRRDAVIAHVQGVALATLEGKVHG